MKKKKSSFLVFIIIFGFLNISGNCSKMAGIGVAVRHVAPANAARQVHNGAIGNCHGRHHLRRGKKGHLGAHRKDISSGYGEINSVPTTQRGWRKELYRLFRVDPLFYKRTEYQKDLDYFIEIIQKHIEDLEAKAALNGTGIKSTAFYRGVVWSFLSALFGGVAYRAAFFSEKDQAFLPAAAMFAGLSVNFAVEAVQDFSKAYHYAARVFERLDRDKHILAVLKGIRGAFEGFVF